MESKYKIANEYFKNKSQIKNYFKEVKNSYSVNQYLTSEHCENVLALLQHHPNANEKIGVGVRGIYVSTRDYGTTCFYVKRVDDSHDSFSYTCCIDNI